MAGKKIEKDVGGGLRGSTSGLRFNPREAPEFAEEDRNYGRDDPKGKEEEDQSKRKEKEARHRKIAGLQHLSLRVHGKKNRHEDHERNDEALSEMTGPVSSTGYPLDVATGAKTGGGSVMGGPNIMTGKPMDLAMGALIQKKATRKEKRERRYGNTDTIQTVRNQATGEKTAKKRKGMGGSTEDNYYKQKLGLSGLPHNNTKKPEKQPANWDKLHRQVGKTKKPNLRRLETRTRRQTTQIAWQKDFRNRHNSQLRNQVARREGTGRGVTKAGTGIFGAAGTMRKGPKSRSAAVPPPPSASTSTPSVPMAPYTARQPRSVSGMPLQQASAASPVAAAGSAFTSPIANTIAASFDTIARAEEYLLKAPQLNSNDITEFKYLIRELKRLLRSGIMRKAGLEDAEHDDDRPSPNAQHKVTSSPTGATEVDPDDDPRYWGAHPIGLLLPRRGHM